MDRRTWTITILCFCIVILIISGVFDYLAIKGDINFPFIKEHDSGILFQRSGSLLVLCALLNEFYLSRSDEESLQNLREWNLSFAALGTMIWGYGDIFFIPSMLIALGISTFLILIFFKYIILKKIFNYYNE